jgi:hypothetical protein
MSELNCNHIYNQVKEKTNTQYCDYCCQESRTQYHSNSFPVSINFFKNNIVFQLKFHRSCFERFYSVNKLKLCSQCYNYYSEDAV